MSFFMLFHNKDLFPKTLPNQRFLPLFNSRAYNQQSTESTKAWQIFGSLFLAFHVCRLRGIAPIECSCAISRVHFDVPK